MTSTVTPDSPNTSVLEGVPGPLIPGTRHDALIGDGAQAVMTRYWQYGKGMNDGTFPEGSYPVLLVHGFRGDHHGLEIIANYLLKLIPNVSIISPDLPGFGRSADLPDGTQDETTQGEDNINAYVAWLNDFVKHTNPAREDAQPLPLHLVGHSFGSIVTSAFAAAHPNSLALLSLINPISEPALEGSQRVASRLASLYYRAGAALPEKIGYPLLRSQLITRASSEVMMRTKDKAMRRFINGQHAAYFGSRHVRDADLPRPTRYFDRRPRAPGHDPRSRAPHPLRNPSPRRGTHRRFRRRPLREREVRNQHETHG